MKLNNKGFAISSIMYIILVMGIILIALTLSIMGSRKLMIDKVKDEALSDIYKVCKLVSGKSNEKGSKYLCEVKPGTKYNFYVLSFNEDGTTNLIMDQNINSDGTLAGTVGIVKNEDNVYNLVAWNHSLNNTSGPITAMQFLYNATKDWINVYPINYEYYDKEIQGESGYTSFMSQDGVATITSFPGISTTIGTLNKPLRVRMLIYSNNATTTEATSMSIASYLYEKLSSGIKCYWTMSSMPGYSDNARYVYYDGTVSSYYIGADQFCGVRPVITVKL